jgi:Uma2 family endonuclease
LVVEVVSDSSVNKDTVRLPPLYAKAGVPELWLIDARGEKHSFRIHTLEAGQYKPVRAGAAGWLRSPRLKTSFRLTRHPTPIDTWQYVLESKPGAASARS